MITRLLLLLLRPHPRLPRLSQPGRSRGPREDRTLWFFFFLFSVRLSLLLSSARSHRRRNATSDSFLPFLWILLYDGYSSWFLYLDRENITCYSFRQFSFFILTTFLGWFRSVAADSRQTGTISLFQTNLNYSRYSLCRYINWFMLLNFEAVHFNLHFIFYATKIIRGIYHVHEI